MTQILYSLFAFTLAIAILITVHEFGHFWVARRVGVKVLRFSIGFGKPLWRFTDKHNTEFVLAAIPIGGYVKMLDENEGEVSKEELEFAFNRKSVWARIAVVIAGPLFNMLFAVFSYWLMFCIGVTAIAPVMGTPLENSIAAKAEIRANHEIIEVNNAKTPSWKRVRLAVISHMGERGALTIKSKNLSTGEVTHNTLNLSSWEIDPKWPNPLESLGIITQVPSIPAIVGSLIPGEPADRAGFMPEDEIVSINRQAVEDWQAFVAFVSAHPEEKLQIQVRRGEALQSLTATPKLLTEEDSSTRGFLGIQSKPIPWPEEWVRVEKYSLTKAVLPALSETATMTMMTFKLLGKMLTGAVSAQSISGPIGIAQGAGLSASIGFAYFLSFLALISISLGVLNILPIPLLDGGHLAYYLFELATGKAVPERVKLFAFRLGLFMILGLMLLAFYNDLARLIG